MDGWMIGLVGGWMSVLMDGTRIGATDLCPQGAHSLGESTVTDK